jgi:hypothetical protein
MSLRLHTGLVFPFAILLQGACKCLKLSDCDALGVLHHHLIIVLIFMMVVACAERVGRKGVVMFSSFFGSYLLGVDIVLPS